MSNEEIFIKKSKLFRVKLGLSEDEIDSLLSDKKLKYKGLELGTRTLTLELAEAYPLIVYGIEYCEFKKLETKVPTFNDLPTATQTLLNNKTGGGNKVGTKGTKNKASYIIYIIKDFPLGHKLTNSKIIPLLPPPINEDNSIDWGKGLLKGHVKNLNQSSYYIDQNGQERREATYEVIKVVYSSALEEAIKNIDKEWLKEFEENTKKK